MTPDPDDTGKIQAKEEPERQPNGRLMPPKSGRFKKGFDPRRNMKGVPRDAIEMRKHMRKIAAEIIGGDETAMTRLDALLRQLFTSRNPAHNKLALQVLDPKILTEQVDLTSGGEKIASVIRIIEHNDNDNDNGA
jgi:hypothetical protein